MPPQRTAAPPPPPAAGPGLLTQREAADFLKISERLLWSLTKEGDVPHVRIGRAVRYDPLDLRRWIEARKQRGVPGGRPSVDSHSPG